MELIPEQPDLPQPASSPPASPALEQLDQSCQDLRTLFLAALVALLVLALGVNLFLAREMRTVRARLSETRPVIQRLEAEFQTKEPNMAQFVAALQSFAFTNREFQPVIDRYRNALPQFFSPTGPINSSGPIPRPAPAAPAATPPTAARPAAR